MLSFLYLDFCKMHAFSLKIHLEKVQWVTTSHPLSCSFLAASHSGHWVVKLGLPGKHQFPFSSHLAGRRCSGISVFANSQRGQCELLTCSQINRIFWQMIQWYMANLHGPFWCVWPGFPLFLAPNCSTFHLWWRGPLISHLSTFTSFYFTPILLASLWWPCAV